ncbi:MAG: hypothetical protein GY749_09360 [Desulfobacteraceae bacterium]|nr:hypothetical protein [Desulfobacteraceae bacterium]
MKNGNTIRQKTALFAGIFFLLCNIVFIFVSQADEITIIGNKDVPVNSLNINEIRSIFLGEKIKWDNTKKITFVILKTKTHENFLRKYLGTTPAQYRNYWRKMVFTGKSKSPRALENPGELIDYISDTSGSVSYIHSGDYNNKVKNISVEKGAYK